MRCKPFLFGTEKVRETVSDLFGRCWTVRGVLGGRRLTDDGVLENSRAVYERRQGTPRATFGVGACADMHCAMSGRGHLPIPR